MMEQKGSCSEEQFTAAGGGPVGILEIFRGQTVGTVVQLPDSHQVV